MNCAVLFLLILCSTAALLAQNSILRGVVTDESGAVVPNATVTLSGPGGVEKRAATGGNGAYSFAGMTAGNYAVQASAPQMVLQQAPALTIRAGTQTLNLRLTVASTTQQIVVEENTGPAVSTDAASNAGATVLQGDDLNSLSDNPEDLQADLQALAGPSAGPGGGAIYIDGFSSGELPPKESIREIRINQNPFSPEFDHLGLGRIEILTKPGTDKYHASLNYNFANDFWNSRNPYSAQKAPLMLQEFENTLSGPINRRTSFALDASQNNVDNGSIVNAVTLAPNTLTPTPLLNIFKTIQRRTRFGPRVDYQLNENNTLTLRYGFTRGDIQGAGIGGFNLTSSGHHAHYDVQTAQAIETSVHGAAVNETRFQVYHNSAQLQADSAGPSIQALGSFTAGGSPLVNTFDTTNNFELQNNTTSVRGAHMWRFGVRARYQTDDSVSPQNFNGTFTFSGGLTPVLDANQRPLLDASGKPLLAQIGAGSGASQFTISAGNPETTVSRFDIAVFAGDDWRLRPNLTLNLGLRYENQPNIQDAADVAPRVGLAWAPGGRASNPRSKTVLRAGFGIFYDRFPVSCSLTAARYNGIVQQQYVVNNPDFFPNVPSPSSLAAFQSQQVIQRVSPSLRSPYVLQSAVTLERRLPKNTTLALTYTNSRGFRNLRSQDANAPFPGTYNPVIPDNGVFPMGHGGPLFGMESNGVFRQNQLLVNVNSRLSRTTSLFGTYVFNHAMSNTDGVETFPANPYSLAGEYGPAAFDVRHRLNFGGSINTKWNVRFNPFVILQSGPPFDITSGSDLYGTTLFHGRPGIATDPSLPGVVQTPYGLLDPNPTPGETLLSRNFGRGPGQISVNMRLAKIFAFGAERRSAQSAGGIFAAPAERHYSLSVSLSMRNLLNHTNPGPIIGNITSPLFGQANEVSGNSNGEGFSENANNRRLGLQIRLAF
ncbi:MAG: carboxypeptidase regulatory-like domain-containing protein [Acidobacteriota bacterium]